MTQHTSKPPWIPAKDELPGVGFALVWGGLAWGIAVELQPYLPFLSKVIVAIALGTAIANTPLHRLLGFGPPGQRRGDRYERGLRFTGKWLLRLAIILMGFKIDIELFEPEYFTTLVATVAFAVPCTFLIVQSTARYLGLRRELGDLVAIGTMICGASAINALAPALLARREEQGLAISVIFVFSVVALVLFDPLSNALGLSPEIFGLWAGSAVNDLSSAIAVGSQQGAGAEALSTAAKSMRIMLLGPLLIGFSLLRATGISQTQGTPWDHFPKFIIGYLLTFALRTGGDTFLGDAAPWQAFLGGAALAVDWLLMAVCLGIGLQIEVQRLLDAGAKTLSVGLSGFITVTFISLGVLWAMERGMESAAYIGGGLALILSVGIYLQTHREGRIDDLRRTKLDTATRLSIREAIDCFEYLEERSQLSPTTISSVLERMSPVIGEIQPLRTAPLSPGVPYRRLTYWESSRGTGSLVGIAWPPAASAHIHTHGEDCWGTWIEGELQVTDFKRVGASHLEVGEKRDFPKSGVEFMAADATLHRLRNVGSVPAIHLHFYGPPKDIRALRYETVYPVNWDEVRTGDKLEVSSCGEVLPSNTLGEWSTPLEHEPFVEEKP